MSLFSALLLLLLRLFPIYRLLLAWPLLVDTYDVDFAAEKVPRKVLAPLIVYRKDGILDAGSERTKLVPQLELYKRRKRNGNVMPDLDQRAVDWGLQIEYSGQTFFDGWDFFTAPDPTHGIINYVDRDTALGQGLAFWTNNGTPGIQVEHWAKNVPGTPRNSVRIHSKSLFAGGLFLIDMPLMPWGCGVWPAFWMLGYESAWPITGEIDIVEGIQSMTNNQITIHTLPGCAINNTQGLFTGSVANPTCDSTTGGSGCSIVSSSNTSYGEPFNALGGGVFACLWDGTGIKMWDWNRAKIPTDITDNQPQPETWGTPTAAWDASTCDPYVFFHAQQLILNIDLCGDWAGNNYAQYPYCPGTCAEYVSEPNNLNNTVMLINYIKVFQQVDHETTKEQALSPNNQTGVGGPIPGNGTNGTDRVITNSGASRAYRLHGIIMVLWWFISTSSPIVWVAI